MPYYLDFVLYGDDVKMQEKDKKSAKHAEGRIQAGNTRGTGDGDPPIYRYSRH